MTLRSDELLEAAAKVADGWNHHWLGTEHLLVAYLDAERQAKVRPFLADAKLSIDAAEAFVREAVPPRDEREEGRDVVSTPRIDTLSGFAHGWAAANSWPDSPTVTAEHVLLALLINGDGVGAQAIRAQEVNVENLIITIGNWLTTA